MARGDSQSTPQDKIDFGLLKNSTNFLTGDIDTESVDKIIKWIVYENSIQSKKPITLYINSTGGSLSDAFALIEVIRNSKRVVRTVGLGSIMSSAFLIFVSGAKGHRYIAKTTSILCHQYFDEIEGKFHDIHSYHKECENNSQRMIDILVSATEFTRQEIKELLLPPTDIWLSSNELIQFGLADRYLEELK